MASPSKNAKDTEAASGVRLESVLPTDGTAWYKRGHLLKLNFIIVSLVLFSSANGFDGSVQNSLQVLDQWEDFMKHPAGAWLGWINAIYWVGCFIGYPLGAWFSNRFGRKAGIYAGYLPLAIGVAVQVSAQNDIAFMMARLFLGLASALFGNGAPLLINEIAYPAHRAIANAAFMSGWYVGGSIAAWATFGTRDYASSWAWRVPCILQLLLPACALPGLLMSPESPRWLVSNDRFEEARAILEEHHNGNSSENSALVEFEYLEITTAIAAEKEAQNSSSYMDMLRTPGNRRRLFISISLGIFSQWAGNGVISYYLTLILDTVGVTSVTDQTLISAFLQVWNLICAVAAAFVVDRLGRRTLFLASGIIMLVSYVIVMGLSASFSEIGHAATGTAVIPFLFVFFFGYDIALTPFLTAYPCEIWPFALRARGLTVTWAAGILAIFFNTFVNPIALEDIAWKYYIVFIVVLVTMIITVYFYYPETRRRTLEEIAVIFDGEAAELPMMTKEAKIVDPELEHEEGNQ
ncbi:hypothetical protein SEUCBS140593_008157 [Sporothrix eucalyptigena]|uniref:Major facilitator superfamily (MFS) profile domain-containing protein n=1 Tax=Sporothrix eucalyptigena TaxID=1812306 RepID=A0ABP0CJU7_9PEZI